MSTIYERPEPVVLDNWQEHKVLLAANIARIYEYYVTHAAPKQRQYVLAQFLDHTHLPPEFELMLFNRNRRHLSARNPRRELLAFVAESVPEDMVVHINHLEAISIIGCAPPEIAQLAMQLWRLQFGEIQNGRYIRRQQQKRTRGQVPSGSSEQQSE